MGRQSATSGPAAQQRCGRARPEVDARLASPAPLLHCARTMLGLGLGEIIVLGFILLVVFSAARMGQLGNAVGKFVYSFKKASKGEDLVDANSKSLTSSRRGSTDAEFSDPNQPRRR
ncbi:twin-arginine translocase TatA/TatE family subunit [Pyxidicoccus sp. MSG2]|uniref:twin-arginine translocase TatA/TatE family subunit n=1 Tax=Pyxidicoccus sp. MSG2 TaxID=2996790 RepID=UPI002270126D|nr:twin-arginine translocase TatA/TatE family subunit [Pyxidicoccus sp. MSG2]MCY1020665.1 twin-arginine translocase TatA/TatE family subunit [Pyxidicoccus sp. MSG2]